MPLRLQELKFGSLLSYSPNGHGVTDVRSRDYMVAVKQDGIVLVDGKPLQMSTYVAREVKQNLEPFSTLFEATPVLVPTPSSSLKKPGSLDVPSAIAQALHKEGLGTQVSECLVRTKPLPKSATSLAANRSTTVQHYDSLEVQDILDNPDSILLVDDVVTRGATLLGAANRLIETYPGARISAFAALRSVSNPSEFRRVRESVIGSITLQSNGIGTLRRP